MKPPSDPAPRLTTPVNTPDQLPPMPPRPPVSLRAANYRNRLPAALSPLAERNFRPLSTGQAVSAIRDSLTPVALAYAALMVGHSATALGVVFAVAILGRVIALPMGGVWADRLPRQLVMLTSDWVRAAVPAPIGLLLFCANAPLWARLI